MKGNIFKKILRFQKPEDELKDESEKNIKVILRSQKPEEELKNESEKNIKVLKCGNCQKTPLCCDACFQEAVIPN